MNDSQKMALDWLIHAIHCTYCILKSLYLKTSPFHVELQGIDRFSTQRPTLKIIHEYEHEDRFEQKVLPYFKMYIYIYIYHERLYYNIILSY